jgi:hypothetical protein
VRVPTPKAAPPHRLRIDVGPQVSAPYLMIIDGTSYRIPQDSARMLRVGKQLQPSDIESVYVVRGLVAWERYHSGGRPVVLIKTKRAAKR